MDTRTKIINAAELAHIDGLVVSGCFDPITAEHAERLAQLQQPGRKLLVLITDPPDPILPSLARAQIVAGLKVVDQVAVAGPGAPKAQVELEAEDAERLRKLIAHVHSRQSAAV